MGGLAKTDIKLLKNKKMVSNKLQYKPHIHGHT